MPVSDCIKEYGINIIVKPKHLQMHFRMNFKRVGGSVILEKERTFVDNRTVEKSVEQLFEKAERAMYPLKVFLNNDGSFNYIENIVEISKRWEKTKKEIKQYYTGPTFESIFDRINYSFENISKIKFYLKRSIFYNLFFLPVYKNYFDFHSVAELDVYFASLSKFVHYETAFKIEKEYSKSDKILLRVTGEEKDLLTRTKKNQGKLDILYKFNRETMEIFSITGKASTFENGIPNEINFELYDIT